MDWVNRHDWPTDKASAYAIQDERIDRVRISGNTSEPHLIAAVEATYGHGGEYLYAAALVLTYPDFEEIERAYCRLSPEFPRSTNLNYFREGPALVGALERLESDVDIIVVHGEGIAHPRRCGTACHLGLDFDKPAFGCCRRLYHGTHRPVGSQWSQLVLVRLRGCWSAAGRWLAWDSPPSDRRHTRQLPSPR